MGLVDKIYEAGVVGAGGAGFPTHFKLDCKAEYYIINGAECEPLLQTDQYLMKEKAEKIVAGAKKAAAAVQADEIILGIKKKYKQQIKSIKQVIQKLDSQLEIYELDNIYPAGDEQIMVYEITGREIPPAGIPLDVGVVVSNAATCRNIERAADDLPVTHRHVTVVGEVKEPTLLQVPVGTSIGQCIAEAGGPTIEDYIIILGGPMLGEIVDKEEAANRGIKKTEGAIILLPEDHYIPQRRNLSIDYMVSRAKSVCIQCSYCTDFCPRQLIGHDLNPHKIMRAIPFADEEDLFTEEVFRQALLCCECGTCELYACPMGLSPREINSYLISKFNEKGIDYEQDERMEVEANQLRKYRKIPTGRLISRINLNKYYSQKVTAAQKVDVEQVQIALKQHIGVSAKSEVSVGDQVERGELIGSTSREDLGANVHASIAGQVIEINSNEIVIQSKD